LSVKIRLKRMGSKKRPFYRIIATDSRNPRDGRFIETLGYYNPISEPADINIKEDLVFRWLRNGAVPSENAESLLRRAGTMKKWSLLKQGVSEAELEAKYEELKSRETQPMSADERNRKKAAEKEKVEAEAKAAAEAEAKAKADEEAAAAAAAAASAEANEAAEEAPADAAPAEGDSPEEEKK